MRRAGALHTATQRPLTNEALIGRDSEDCWQSLLYVTLVITSWRDNIMTALKSQAVFPLKYKKIKEITWSVLWISVSPLPPCSR